MTFIRDYVPPAPHMDGPIVSMGKLIRGFPNQPYRFVEDPHIRELFEGMYRLRRGHWDIADVPEVADPPAFDIR